MWHFAKICHSHSNNPCNVYIQDTSQSPADLVDLVPLPCVRLLIVAEDVELNTIFLGVSQLWKRGPPFEKSPSVTISVALTSLAQDNPSHFRVSTQMLWTRSSFSSLGLSLKRSWIKMGSLKMASPSLFPDFGNPRNRNGWPCMMRQNVTVIYSAPLILRRYKHPYLLSDDARPR